MSVLIPGARAVLEVGGRVFTDLTNLIILRAKTTSGTNSSFRTSGGSGGYQVTTGKTLTIRTIRQFQDAAVSNPWSLLYSDNDMGFATATAPTNPIYSYGQTSTSTPFVNSSAGATGERQFHTNFAVPATKYVGVTAAEATATKDYEAYGYEV